MTSDPAAPNEDAVYLYREETTDDTLHTHALYVRLKILTEKGKEYADVGIPYEGRHFNITSVRGRTIHSDGTIVPFTGKPFDRVAMKTATEKYMVKVFSMPDVQVGSIIEYRYDLLYDDGLVLSPQWYIQQALFVHKAHYLFVPYPYLDRIDAKGGYAGVAYVPVLPKGSSVQTDSRGRFSLDLTNIPPEPSEDYLPPIQSISYRLLFYYTGYHKAEDFWAGEGKQWSKRMDKFATPSSKLTDATREILSGVGAPDQKLATIYSTVMKMDNTDFSREHTAEENKAEGFKQVNSAEDVFELKRGSSNELALLFIAMARAAGFKAYAMQVTNRDRSIFIESYLDMGQLDDVIAIVQLSDKEIYLDPGERYCTFGQLHWKHTMTTGLRQTDHGTAIANTPAGSYQDTQITRFANLNIDPNGKVQGIARVFLSGVPALFWRQRALETDDTEVKKDFDNELQRNVPPGVQVKTKAFVNLTDPSTQLMAVVDVSGSMGTATTKRVFLPTFFFEAGTRPLFAHDHRENPVDLRYPYLAEDTVTITLPNQDKVEASPQNAKFALSREAYCATEVKVAGTEISVHRVLGVARTLYMTGEYPALKTFMDKVNANDQQTAVLDRGSSGASGQ